MDRFPRPSSELFMAMIYVLTAIYSYIAIVTVPDEV